MLLMQIYKQVQRKLTYQNVLKIVFSSSCYVLLTGRHSRKDNVYTDKIGGARISTLDTKI